MHVFKVKVVSTFLETTIRGSLEEGGHRLTGRKSMADLIPFILAEEKEQIKTEISGKDASVVFDGTCRLGEALVIIFRSVDNELTIKQRVVWRQLLAKSLCGEERELITLLSTELGIASERLVACMHDRASSNRVAMQTISIIQGFPYH
jgi:hypothetical protein